MISISTVVVTVRHPDGRSEDLQVDSERVLVGSGAHCEIRLPREHAAIEALLIEAKSGGIFAEARSLHPPPLLNGMPFTAGRLLTDAVVVLGQLQLTVRVIETSAQGGAARSQSSAGKLTYSVAAAMLAGALYMLANAPSAEAAFSSLPPAPPLWTSAGKASCPHRDPGSAAAYAAEQNLLAEGKRERAPFYLQDGVAAVQLFQVAAVCFDAGGASAAAREAELSAATLRKEMSDAFHVHQVRLERALVVKDYDGARTELQLLLGLLQGRKNEYVTYLANLDRKIELKFSGKKAKAL
jgi:hypothetical protein